MKFLTVNELFADQIHFVKRLNIMQGTELQLNFDINHEI